MNIVEKLISLQLKGHYKIPHFLLAVMGLEIPREVKFPANDLGGVHFVHRATGTVLHPKTELGRNVQIYQNVTIGSSKPWDASYMGGCEVMDDVIICAGAKCLFGKEKLIIGKGTIIGANSVLLHSTGVNEIWAGVPAKKIGNRF